MIETFIRRFRYWMARKLTGYGEIHLRGEKGWAIVSVTIRGREVDVIHEYVGDREVIDTMSHWVTELGILECSRRQNTKIDSLVHVDRSAQ